MSGTLTGMSYAWYWTAVFFVLTIVACLICVALVRALRALAEAIVAAVADLRLAVQMVGTNRGRSLLEEALRRPQSQALRTVLRKGSGDRPTTSRPPFPKGKR